MLWGYTAKAWVSLSWIEVEIAQVLYIWQQMYETNHSAVIIKWKYPEIWCITSWPHIKISCLGWIYVLVGSLKFPLNFHSLKWYNGTDHDVERETRYSKAGYIFFFTSSELVCIQLIWKQIIKLNQHLKLLEILHSY